MKATMQIVIGAVLATALASPTLAVNSVVVESRTFSQNQAACTVGIWLTNDVHVTGLFIPLEARSLTGGAFYQGMSTNPLILNPGMRVDRSPLGSADPGGGWPAASMTRRRFETPSTQNCGGPVSKSYSTAVATLSGTSPDGFSFATAASGDGNFGQDIDLDPGPDPPVRDSASWIFVITTNALPGCFEIDTCCTLPAGHIVLVDVNTNPITPEFTKGTICVDGILGNLPPVIECPEYVSVPVLFTDSGRTVDYTVSYTDEDSTLIPVCDAPSGSFFYQGNTDVTCIVTDTFGLADTCVFPVIVYDTGAPTSNQPPVLHCGIQPYVTVEEGESGGVVTYSVSYFDEDPTLVPVYDPPSGSFFPLGVSLVTVTVTDTFGLSDTCAFPVSVSIGADQNSVVIESRTFAPSETNCRVGVFISNAVPITGFVIPLELRTLSGGAYPSTPIGSSGFAAQTGRRLDASPLGSADITGHWPAASRTKRLFAVTTASSPNCTSTNDSDVGWNEPAVALDGSPDAVSYATVSSGDPNLGELIALPPGSDQMITSEASLVFTFDATSDEGCFVIDTTCIRPAGHIDFVDLGTSPITPSFTAGTICISSCICECHGNPANCANPSIDVLDVIYVLNVAFRGQPAIPDNNPLCPVSTTDLNCDGVSDIIDAVRIVNVAFRGADSAAEFCDPCP